MTAARRLAAILAVDVVGYSRLMGEDEVGTARAVREHREAASPIVAEFGGRIVKTMGDGVLLEFPSVVAAVECAIAIQKLMRERNADAPSNKQILYRIGVNLGDVLIEGEDILGDGVNIAARLEGVCEPGGVLISGAAYEHVRGRIDANFVDLGEKTLKNIARPVRAFAVRIGSESAAPAPSALASNKVSRRELSTQTSLPARVAAVGIDVALFTSRAIFADAQPSVDTSSTVLSAPRLTTTTRCSASTRLKPSAPLSGWGSLTRSIRPGSAMFTRNRSPLLYLPTSR